MKKTAIVTGADGFIGSRLVKKLINEGYFVYCVGVSKNKLKLPENDGVFIKAFFEDYDDLVNKLPLNCDLFYHFAWNGISGEYFKDYLKQLNNCMYACKAMEIAIKLKTKKFVLASTINELEIIKAFYSNEKIEPRFTNTYSVAKFAAETICKTLAYNYGIKFNCGLISMVYGKGNCSKTVQNIAIKNFLFNKDVNLVDKKSPYDLIHVDDVAEAFYLIGEKGINLKTYFVGHSSISTFGELFDSIKCILNSKSTINYGVYKDKSTIDYSMLDLKALEVDCGFKCNISLKDGILETAEFLGNTELK